MCKQIYTCLLLLAVIKLQAQVCTLPGQTPATAFAICYNGSFFQSTLPACRNNSFYVPGCTNQNTNYGDNNPVYYKFTCRTAGSFGFTITPVNANDNYDWMLFDITGHPPNEIFTDKTLVVTGNWSGTTGSTGAASDGANFIQCRSLPQDGIKPTFSSMPQLQTGHDYLLMVGNIDDRSTGYSLSVNGGTADITSDANQQINSNASSCDNKQVTLRFNKKIRCNSIAIDGSDFSLTPALGNIIKATGSQCNSGLETDSIIITFANPLPDGSYILSVKNGSDGNTLLDKCDNVVSGNTQIPFSVFAFALIDTVVPSGCKPSKLKIKTSKNIICNSVAANGSDFFITGPGNAIITAATVNCSNTMSDSIELVLQQPLTVAGNYKLTIKNGSDGNTFIDACNGLTPANTSFNFNIKDTVNANFRVSILEGCVADTINFIHPGGNEINRWFWTIDSSISNLQQLSAIIATGGPHWVELIVSNGVCSDTSQQSFVLKQKLKIDFAAPGRVCPNEPVVFINNSINSGSLLWDFGNGTTSSIQNPPAQFYPISDIDKQYQVTLTVQDGSCTFTKTHALIAESSCSISVPTAFTPNKDGLNDFFEPLKTNSALQLQLIVYNRYGQAVFQTSGTNSKWDGTTNGHAQPAGMYTWVLSYTDRRTSKNIARKGTVLLIR